MIALVLAHFGHVIVDVPLFLGPVILLAGALLVSTRRARRRDGEDGVSSS